MPDGIDIDDLRDRFELSCFAVENLVSAGYPIVSGISGGKDSVLVANIVLHVLRKRKDLRLPTVPVCFVHADTGVEHPQVHDLALRTLAAIETFGEKHGLDVRTVVTKPNPAAAWYTRIISGRKMPASRTMNADCTNDLKIRPVQRATRAFFKEMADAHRLTPVTLTGVRFDESAARASNMRKRGESDVELFDENGNSIPTDGSEFTAWRFNDGRKFRMSPIANWATEQVFAFLQRSAGLFNQERGHVFPCFQADFSELLALYGSAAGDACLTDVSPAAQQRGCSGSGRFGCHTCLKVSDDTSMRKMLWDPDNEYMRPLYEMREFLKRTENDLSRRRWIGRDFHPITQAVTVFPNCYNSETCELLLRALLSIDVREQRRAAGVADELAAGTIEDTPRSRRMAKPQFQNITLPMVFLIDFYWALDHFFDRPYHALWIYRDVVERGNLIDVPVANDLPRPTMPELRYLPYTAEFRPRGLGALDELSFMTCFEAEGDLLASDVFGEEATEILPSWAHSDLIEIDEESMALWMGAFFDAAMVAHDSGTGSPVAAASSLLRIGVVGYPHGRKADLNRYFDRSVVMGAMGLTGRLGPDDVAAMATQSVGEHDAAVIGGLRTLGAEVESLPRSARERATLYKTTLNAFAAEQEAPSDVRYDHTFRKCIGLEVAVKAGHVFFDGLNLRMALARGRRQCTALAAQLSAANVEAIEAAAIQDAIDLAREMRQTKEPIVRPGFGIQFAIAGSAIDIDALRKAATAHNQLSLFAA